VGPGDDESGRRVEFPRVRPLIGIGADKLMPELTGLSIDSPEAKAIAARRREIFQHDYLPQLKPTRGAQALLEWLRDDRKKLVVASSAEDEELRLLLEVAGASKLIESATSSDDARQSKPDPDIVGAAIVRTGVPVAEVIMVGDTPYDVEAALRAGIEIIGLRSGGWSDQELTGAVAVYADPADLLEHYDVSPFKRPLPARSA
jgi:HAD superfamily hydrolase (TIGR01509 family)